MSRSNGPGGCTDFPDIGEDIPPLDHFERFRMTDVPIRDASTVLVLRDAATNPAVLMGQRGAGAAFMPNKFVFPGGAVDLSDAGVPLAASLHPSCSIHLTDTATRFAPKAFAVAAIRELWEETGLILGTKTPWRDAPPQWVEFAAAGYSPSAHGLRYIFRAITPPGPPRRFDARFFLVDATQIATDLDDFSRASDELSQLQWIPLDVVRDYDLPLITRIVLSEVASRLPSLEPPANIPLTQREDEEQRRRPQS